MPDGIHGGRPHRGTDTYLLPIAAEVELAVLLRTGLLDGTQDKKKCFDYIMSELGIQIWEYIGLEDPYLDAMRAFEWESDTYVKLQGSYHRVGRRANSIFQGDAGAMAKANTIFAVFSRRLEFRTPYVRAITYVDDGIMSTNQRNHKSFGTAWQESIKFNEMTGQKPNFKKSHIWGTTTQARRAVRSVVMDREVNCLMSHKSVGYALTTGKRVSRTNSDARVDKALKTLQRIKALPIKPIKKEYYVGAKAMREALYGAAVCGMKLRTRSCLAARACNVIFSQKRIHL